MLDPNIAALNRSKNEGGASSTNALIAMTLPALAASGLTACNTAEDAGKGRRSAGSAVSQASEQSGTSK
jgi:predicted small secreted protein